MKKLLSLLSVLTVSGTAIPATIAASPYQKEETIRLNRIKRSINLQKINNLINVKNELSEKIKDMGKKINEECQLITIFWKGTPLTIQLQEIINYFKEDLPESIKSININENNLKQSIQDIGKNIKNFGTKMQEIGEIIRQAVISTSGSGIDIIKIFINIEDFGNISTYQGIILEKIGEVIDLYKNENLTTDNISEIKHIINVIGYNINNIGIDLTINETIKYYPDVLPGLKDYRMIVKPWLTNELNGYVLGNNVKEIGTKLENIQINNNQISNQNINDLGKNIEDLGKEMENVSLIISQVINLQNHSDYH